MSWDRFVSPDASDLMSDVVNRPIKTMLRTVPLTVFIEELTFRVLVMYLLGTGALGVAVSVVFCVAVHLWSNVREGERFSVRGFVFLVAQTALALALALAYVRWGLLGAFSGHLLWDWLLMGALFLKNRNHKVEGAVVAYDSLGVFVLECEACGLRREGPDAAREAVIVYRLGFQAGFDFMRRMICSTCWGCVESGAAIEWKPRKLAPVQGGDAP